MKVEDLFESPVLVEPTTFNLYNKRFNKKLAHKLLQSSKRRVIYSINDDIHLYEYPQAYALIDISTKEILYYMKYKFLRKSFLPKPAAQQVLVWRNMKSAKTGRIASKIFFDFLLPKTGIVVTDAEQTENGQEFWFNRIGEAFEKRLFVYYVDIMQPIKIIRINGYKDLDNYVDKYQIWGDHKKNLSRRIIISDTELNEK